MKPKSKKQRQPQMKVSKIKKINQEFHNNSLFFISLKLYISQHKTRKNICVEKFKLLNNDMIDMIK